MFIQTEQTPNPVTLKFLPGQPVLTEGTADFRSAEDAAGKSPLAERLFAIDKVAAVSLGADDIAVTKAADADWGDLKAAVLAAIMEHFVEGKPALLAGAAPESPETPGADTEVVAQIKELIETRIAPAVAQSGGEIAFRGFEDGIVLLDHVNQLRRSGLPRDEALVRAGRERLRPILMTAVTTIIGLVPLAVRGPAMGGLFYYPLARTVMGGLMSSVVLTLLILPYFYTLMEFLASWFGRIWSGSARSGEPAPASVAPGDSEAAPA